MKIVEYSTSLQWVCTMKCPKCGMITRAWRSSGMSMCFPHFYCNLCSNVIHRKKDQALVSETKSQEMLNQIKNDLPDCQCGGHFAPGENPKCSHCGEEFPHQSDPLTRLDDPHMIVVDGACVYGDEHEPYKVKIINDSLMRRLKKLFIHSF